MLSKTKRRFCTGCSAERIHTISGKAVIVWMLLCSITPLYAAPPWLHVEGNKVKDPNGNIVVLKGVCMVDVGGQEMWYGGVFPLIDRLTNKDDPNGDSPGWYPKVIRIPVYPQDSVDFDSPFTFDPNNDDFYNNLLRPVIDYCAEKDVYAVIDWHYITSTFAKVAETNEFWQYMAQRFNNDSHVLFELFNEPINSVGTDAQSWASVRTDMQTWIDTIRTYAPNNLILVGTPRWCQVVGPTADNPVDDSNVIYVSHIYPYHWLSSNRYYRDSISAAAAVHPVILGEWGFISDSSAGILNGTIANYGQPLKEFLEEEGVGNIAWVASYDWNPHMFDTNWQLLCGDGYMGCFVKDWLYETSSVDGNAVLAITKCTVTAGKVQGQDSFSASGTFRNFSGTLSGIAQIDVNLISQPDGALIYTKSLGFSVVNNKYTYKGGTSGIVSLIIDFGKGTFAIKAKNINLTGLDCPLKLEFVIGSSVMSDEAGEAIVNGPKKLIPIRLMRTYADVLGVTKAKSKHGVKPSTDSFSVSGEIAVRDMNDPNANLAVQDVNVMWGAQTFTIPAGSFTATAGHSYKCSKVPVDANNGLMTATIDLDKCAYTVSGAKMNLDVATEFGLRFADFNQIADIP